MAQVGILAYAKHLAVGPLCTLVPDYNESENNLFDSACYTLPARSYSTLDLFNPVGKNKEEYCGLLFKFNLSNVLETQNRRVGR